MWRKWLIMNWRRLLILLVCIALILDRQIWHKIQFDTVTICLIVIIAVILLFPNPQVLFPYVKRIKLWQAEIELKEELKELNKEVEKAQGVSSITIRETTSVPPDVEEVLRESSKDPRAALLLLSTKIEREIKKSLDEAGVVLPNKYISASEAVQKGVRAGIFSDEFSSAFRDFWTVRNRVAHAEGFDVSDNTILSLISLGTELLKVISPKSASAEKTSS